MSLTKSPIFPHDPAEPTAWSISASLFSAFQIFSFYPIPPVRPPALSTAFTSNASFYQFRLRA